MVSWTLLLGVAEAATNYPFTYTSCGVEYEVSGPPAKAVTMNQGATEFLLALGVHDKMVGTAYLDDSIWPKYATQYAKIPVLAGSEYPTETVLMDADPDFIVGSYFSAFLAQYEDGGKTKGIFSDATVGPCTGEGSEWQLDKGRTTCRPQLHSNNIGTYLFEDACENSDLRPQAVTEETVYREMRALGRIFNVDPEPLITDMKADFDAAASMVGSEASGKALKAVWLDCVGRCCKDENGVADPNQVYVGSGDGAPNMLMREAGLSNVFSETEGNWACVDKSEILAADPDVLIVVDAAWDTALDKLTWLYSNSAFCELTAMKGARFVHIPFSATTLSPRNGPAALDLAIASLHVRLGTLTAVRESGVSSFNPRTLETHVQGLACAIDEAQVMYLTDGTTTGPAGTTRAISSDNESSSGAHATAICMSLFSVLAMQLAM
jgi:iron complex transport system substrate-binding protein